MAPRIPALRPALRLALSRTRPSYRLARPYSAKAPNPTSQFYKTFTRPIAKVLLLAVFTYQLAYWGWLRLETDELRAEADTTIAGLERTVDEYKAKMAEEAEKAKPSS